MDKIVYIKRRPYDRAKVGKDAELVAAEKRSIGGSMTLSGGVLKGIDFSEERILMPFLTGLPGDHPEFMKASNAHFNDFKKKVPLEGLKLNISLENDSLPLSKENMPKNIEDYILYRYCQVYSKVAENLERCKNDDNKWFFIYSEVISAELDNVKAKLRTDSVREYAKIAEDEAVIDTVLRVLAGRNKKDGKQGIGASRPDDLTLIQKQNILSEVSIHEPALFLDVVKDKHLTKLSEIYDMIDSGIIETPGNKYIFEGEELGTSPEHVVSFINAAANSKKYTIMKARLDAIKQTVKA